MPLSDPGPPGSIRPISADAAAYRLGERGVGAVEFALIIPFILVLIIGIIEMSNIYFMRNQLSEIARDATRRFAVGALDENSVKTFALQRLAETTNATGSVQVSETEVGDIIDVSLSLSIPFADVLLFDQLIADLWSSAPEMLTASATMMKH